MSEQNQAETAGTHIFDDSCIIIAGNPKTGEVHFHAAEVDDDVEVSQLEITFAYAFKRILDPAFLEEAISYFNRGEAEIGPSKTENQGMTGGGADEPEEH